MRLRDKARRRLLCTAQRHPGGTPADKTCVTRESNDFTCRQMHWPMIGVGTARFSLAFVLRGRSLCRGEETLQQSSHALDFLGLVTTVPWEDVLLRRFDGSLPL